MGKKIRFRDMKIGQIFYAYGDEVSNYDYPKECVFKKTGEYTATEIEDGRETQHNLVDERTEFYIEE